MDNSFEYLAVREKWGKYLDIISQEKYEYDQLPLENINCILFVIRRMQIKTN